MSTTGLDLGVGFYDEPQHQSPEASPPLPQQPSSAQLPAFLHTGPQMPQPISTFQPANQTPQQPPPAPSLLSVFRAFAARPSKKTLSLWVLFLSIGALAVFPVAIIHDTKPFDNLRIAFSAVGAISVFSILVNLFLLAPPGVITMFTAIFGIHESPIKTGVLHLIVFGWAILLWKLW